MTASVEKPVDGLPFPARYGAMATIILGITLAVMDGAIANVALPSIARDLMASPAQSIWIINAYQIAIITTLLSLSFLGDILGYHRIYKSGLIIFIITSALCAFSTSLEMLTFARVLQGFGAAALMSVNTALIRVIYPKQMLGRAMGLNSLVVAVSAAAAPTIAAGILSLASWKWLFLINLPWGGAALWLAWRYLPPNSKMSNGVKFDPLSALLNAAFFGLLLYTFGGVAQGQPLWQSLTGIAAIAVIGLIFIRRQAQLAVPLLPLDLLRIPIFTLSLCTSICSFCAQMMALISLPFFLQDLLGKSEVQTGLLLSSWPLTIVVIAPIAGRLIGKVHAGLLGAIGLSLFGLGLLLLGFLPERPDDLNIVLRLMLCGAGFGFFQSPNNHTIISSAPVNRSGGASGMLGTARLLGQSMGAALVALFFNLLGNQGSQAALISAGVFALLGAGVSLSRSRVMKKSD